MRCASNKRVDGQKAMNRRRSFGADLNESCQCVPP